MTFSTCPEDKRSRDGPPGEKNRKMGGIRTGSSGVPPLEGVQQASVFGQDLVLSSFKQAQSTVHAWRVVRVPASWAWAWAWGAAAAAAARERARAMMKRMAMISGDSW